MHAVLDHDEAIPPRQIERRVHIHGDAERVLEEKHLRALSDQLLGLLEVDVVVGEPAVDEDGPPPPV